MAGSKTVLIRIAGKLDKSVSGAVKGAMQQFSSLSTMGKMRTIAAGTTKVLGATALAMGATAAYVVKKSVDVGKEFESAMASAAATAGASEAEYAMMKQAAVEAGKTTSKTAAESANALEYMSLAGWDVKTSTDALLPVLHMAEATGMDLARTSDLVTDAMSATGTAVGEGGKGLEGFMDIAIRAQNKSNQSAEQLMEAWLGVGGVMSGLGVPIQDSATALGVLANRGTKGSEAGTALRAIMANLTTGQGEAGKMMQSLGISAFNADGSFKVLEATLQTVNEATKGMTEQQKNATLAAIGGKRHVDTLNKLLQGLNETNENGVSEWSALNKELNNANGALETMRDTKMDTLAGQTEIFKSALNTVGLSIYDGIQEPLKNIVKFGVDEVGKLQSAFDSGGFSGLVGAIGTVLGDVVTQVATNAPQIMQGAVTLVQSFVNGIAQNAPAIGQGVGQMVAVFFQGLYNMGPSILGAAVSLVGNFLMGLSQNSGAILSAGMQMVADILSGISGNVFGIFGAVMQIISTFVSGIVSNLPQIISAGIQIIISLIAGLIQGIPTILAAIPGIIVAVVKGFIDGFKNADWSQIGTSIKNGIKSAFTGDGIFGGAIKGMFGKGGDTGAAQAAGQQQGAAVGQGFQIGLNQSQATANNALMNFGGSSFSMDTSGAQNTGLQHGLAVGQGYQSGLQQSMSSAGTAATPIDTSAYTASLQAAQQQIDAAVQGIQASMQNAQTQVSTAMTQIGTVAQTGMQGVVTAAQSGMAQFVATIAGGTAQAVGLCRACASGMRAAFAGLNLYSAGANAMAGLRAGIAAGGAAAIAQARSIATQISATMNSALKINSPSKVTTKTGMGVDEGLIKGMRSMSPDVMRAAVRYSATPVVEGTSMGTLSTLGLNSTSPISNMVDNTVSGKGSGAIGGNGNVSVTYSPTINVNGSNLTREDVSQAVSTSYADFERFMKQYQRENRRVALA